MCCNSLDSDLLQLTAYQIDLTVASLISYSLFIMDSIVDTLFRDIGCSKIWEEQRREKQVTTDTRFLSDLWRLLVTSIKSFTPALLFPDESVPFFVNQSNITK